MKYIYSFLIVLILKSLAFGSVKSDDLFVEQLSLNAQLKIYNHQQDSFEPLLPNNNTQAVYLQINLKEFSGRYLAIKCKPKTSLFLDNVYWGELSAKENILSIDSLVNVWPSSAVTIALFNASFINKDLEISIVKKISSEESITGPATYKRYHNDKRDFFILVSLVLLVFFAGLLRSNPRFTLDYINVRRVLSFKDREENILNTRLTSTTNLIYYGFCSLLISAILIFLSTDFGGRYFWTEYLQFDSLWTGFLIWIFAGILVFVLITFKLVFLLAFISLFDLRNFLPTHHFNFLRLSIIVSGLIVVVMLATVTAGGEPSAISNYLWTFLYISFGFWVLMIFIKLIARAEYRLFHLFSYICATELIPFLIISKVMYF